MPDSARTSFSFRAFAEVFSSRSTCRVVAYLSNALGSFLAQRYFEASATKYRTSHPVFCFLMGTLTGCRSGKSPGVPATIRQRRAPIPLQREGCFLFKTFPQRLLRRQRVLKVFSFLPQCLPKLLSKPASQPTSMVSGSGLRGFRVEQILKKISKYTGPRKAVPRTLVMRIPK